MIMTEAKEQSDIKTCDKCGKSFCTHCFKVHQFMKWSLCHECFDPFDRKRQERKKRIQEKKDLKKKFPGYFTLEFHEAREIKAIFKMLASTLNNPLQLRFSPKGVVITAIDISKISLLQITLDTSYFKNIEPKKGEIDLYFQDTDQFNSVLDFIPDTESFKLMKKCGKDYIEIITARDKACLQITPHDPEDIPINPILRIDYPSAFVLDPEVLFNICQKASLISGIITILTTENGVKFTVEHINLNVFESQISLDDLIEKDLNGENKLSLSLDKIIAFLKDLIPVIEKLEIQMNSIEPIRLNVTLKDHAQIIFFQAPRVLEDSEDDEDEDEYL